MPINPAAPIERYATESPKSGVSWASIFAGALVIIAVSMILAMLGAGLGFASTYVTPDKGGIAPKAVSVMYVIWLVIIQWVAAGLGAYITGRLRTKWANLHTHEVFFRDTAHGFIAWCLATVVIFMLFMSAAGHVAKAGASMAASTAIFAEREGENDRMSQMDGTNQRVGQLNPLMGDIDGMFHSDRPALAIEDQQAHEQALRILAKGMKDSGAVTEGDKSYMASLISMRTGVSQTEARRRVDDTLAREQDMKAQMLQAADDARKAAAKLAIGVTLSLLVGAFVACVCASLGGRVRDLHP